MPHSAEGAVVAGRIGDRDAGVVCADEGGRCRKVGFAGEIAVFVETGPSKSFADVWGGARCAPSDGGVVVGGCCPHVGDLGVPASQAGVRVLESLVVAPSGCV